jgi:hypothetical protein
MWLFKSVDFSATLKKTGINFELGGYSHAKKI